MQREAIAACKRHGLVDPAWQRVLLARRLPQSETTARAGVTPYLSCGRNPGLVVAVAGFFFGVQSREAIDKQRLHHWRRELAELVSEAGLPIAAQAQLAPVPDEIIVVSLGAMRAILEFARRFASGARSATSAWVLVDALGPLASASCWTICASVLMNLAVAPDQKLLFRLLSSCWLHSCA